jgi:hypothetical protein
MIVIHSTHEAEFKMGGIGAVLDGLLSAPSYLAQVERSLLVGPMNTHDKIEMERLFSPRNKLKVRYFSASEVAECPLELAEQFKTIEANWNVRLLYGTRAFAGALHEIILVDPGDINNNRFNQFKYFVWERFGLDCARYENEYEFNLYMAIAQPGYEALTAVLETHDLSEPPRVLFQPPVIFCHEFMGLPLWYAAELSRHGAYKSAYVAHEVATVRALIENDPGHDTRFYNVLRNAQKSALTIDEVFGDQSDYFKHALTRTAALCDYVLAVGDLVVDELRFIDNRFRGKKIDLVYNGSPSRQVFIETTGAASAKLKAYAQTLVGFLPTFVFSHVTRMVISKGLWRDIRVMEELDHMLLALNESAVLFILSSIIPQGRSAAEAQRMSREYGWPKDHREGWPDLIALETPLWEAISKYNTSAKASRIVLINQFGFSRDRCGDTMPADTSFEDLRNGVDVEFGQSIYEPFGIAQLEPLPSGALCVISNVCGCLGFVRRKLSELPRLALTDEDGPLPEDLEDSKRPFLNVVVADYTSLTVPTLPLAMRNGPDLRTSLSIGQVERDLVERQAARDVADAVAQRLPRTNAQKTALIDAGYMLAQQISWDVVAREMLLPAITR